MMSKKDSSWTENSLTCMHHDYTVGIQEMHNFEQQPGTPVTIETALAERHRSTRNWCNLRVIAGVLLSVCLAMTGAADSTTAPLQSIGLGAMGIPRFGASGRQALTCGGDRAYLWDSASGTLIRQFRTNRVVIDAEITSDGKSVFAALAFNNQPPQIKKFDAATGVLQWTRTDVGYFFYRLAVSPDGTMLAASIATTTESAVYLINTSSGELMRSLPRVDVDENYVDVQFSEDGTLLASGTGAHIRVWQASTGTVVNTLSFTGGFCLYPDNQRILVFAQGWCSAYEISSGYLSFSLPAAAFQGACALTHSGTTILRCSTYSGGYRNRYYDANTGAELTSSFGTTAVPYYTASFSEDDSQVLLGEPGGAIDTIIANCATGATISAFFGHMTNLQSFELIGSGDRLAVATGGYRMEIIRSDTGAHEQYLPLDGSIKQVEYSPGGTRLAAGGLGSYIFEYDAGTGDYVYQYPSGRTDTLAYTHDGSRLLSTYHTTGTIWNTITHAKISQFVLPSDLMSLAVSPDDQHFVTGTGSVSGAGYIGDVVIWNLATASVESSRTLMTSGNVLSVSYSPDGQMLLACGATYADQSAARVYSTTSGLQLFDLVGHNQGVRSGCFSHDGSLIATASNDLTVRLWDATNGQPLGIVATGLQAYIKVEFSADDSRLFVASDHIDVFELRPARALVIAGGGNFAGNGIAQQTNDLAAYAYKTLKTRGYSASEVQYLSAFGARDADGDGLNDVDELATLDSFHNTLTSSFARAAGRLMILMLDHGYKTDNFMAFRINETQTLPSTTLNTWLNELQTNYPVDVTLVVDSCYSGKIVDDCSTAPAGRKRTVISSTTRDAEAVFCPSPDLSSFMYTFLGSAYMGNSIGEAFRAGKRFFEAFPVANQVPQISDGSTTMTNADREFFGKSWAYGVQSTTDANQFFPAFSDITSTQTVSPGTAVPLSATLLQGQDPTNVTCVIRPPAPAVLSGDPITTLPQLTMVRRSNDAASPDYRVWETTSSAETFSSNGSYTVSFTAQFANQRVANPVFTNVTVSAGTDPDQTSIRSILVVGSTTNSDMSTAFQNLGPYAYATYLGRFADNSGVHHPEWIDYYANYTDANKDGAATSTNVTNSINNLSNTIGRLYVHVIGDSSAQGGVRMASGDILTATALDTALDALQSRQTCAVVLIVDAPYSGAFLNTCKATGVQQRVVMTSGKPGEQAMFLGPPLKTSFSEKVLGAGLQGNDLNTAFNSGKKFFANFKRSITPQLDDNGSGSYSGSDGSLANTIYLGRRYAFAGDDGSGLPFILDVTTTQTVAPGTYVQYKTTLIEGVVPSRVYLQLTPDSSSDLTPVASVPTIDLSRDNPTSWTWSANFYAPTPPGTYAMVLYADYPNAAQVKPTQPQYTGLIVSGTPTTSPIKDMDNDGYEDAVELRAGTSPLDPSAHPSGFPYDSAADSDGDGFKDFYEYELGYDPSSATNYPPLADINGDGTVNGADAIILKRIAVGTVQAADYFIANMDLNRDGVINGADAILIQRYVVHTVTVLPSN